LRLGLCCRPEEGPAALAAGYDYVEYPAASREPSETTNLFYPGDVRLYGPEADGLKRGKAIIDAAALRGVRIMVLGSGGVRKTEGDINEAERIFYDLAAELDRYAQTLGLRVAPESLNPTETNVATSLPDMARALATRDAPYTADSYHALVETGTPDADLDFWREQVPFAPIHVHFAPFDRSTPTGEDASLKKFFARLKELGYDGRASLECRRDGIPDASQLRRLFE
jgi:D-psicose/D-tagatose/L-ribulose 3-epimerase